MGPGQ